MKILMQKDDTMYSPLEAWQAGTPIRFKSAFHDKHKPDDLFIINAVCSSYRPDDRKYLGKIAVTNLRTGELAYVDKQRPCIHVKAVVTPGEDCPC